MNKQLLMILKKRYGIFILITSLAIVLFYGFLGFSDVNRWKDSEAYYNSEAFKKELKEYPEENDPRYEGLSQNDLYQALKKDGLMLFFTTQNYDENNKLIVEKNPDYYTTYFNENPLLLIGLVSVIGFCLFFVDLKSSFNEFLFSLGVSKKNIYLYKYFFVAVPILISILIAKCLFIGIILMRIPNEYINIGISQLFSYILSSWITCLLYFSLAVFVGLVTGHLMLGPLTALGLCITLSYFISSITEAWVYFTNQEPFLDTPNTFLVYTVAKTPINMAMMVIGVLCSLSLFIIGYLLFSTLTLENKGRYLLFKQLKLPVVILTTVYVPIVLVFSRGYYFGDEAESPVPRLLLYFVITLVVTCYIVYREELHLWLTKKRDLQSKMDVTH